MNYSEYIDFCPTECGWKQTRHEAYKKGYYTWGEFQMMKLNGPNGSDIPVYRLWWKTHEGWNMEGYNGALNKTLLHEIMRALDAIITKYS